MRSFAHIPQFHFAARMFMHARETRRDHAKSETSAGNAGIEECVFFLPLSLAVRGGRLMRSRKASENANYLAEGRKLANRANWVRMKTNWQPLNFGFCACENGNDSIYSVDKVNRECSSKGSARATRIAGIRCSLSSSALFCVGAHKQSAH